MMVETLKPKNLYGWLRKNQLRAKKQRNTSKNEAGRIVTINAFSIFIQKSLSWAAAEKTHFLFLRASLHMCRGLEVFDAFAQSYSDTQVNQPLYKRAWPIGFFVQNPDVEARWFGCRIVLHIA